jgi:hypothetical protein
MPRPEPAVVKAKLQEIAQRYARKYRRRTKPQFAAIRVAELNRLFRARHGDMLPDSPIGRACLWIVAQHLIQLAGAPLPRLMRQAELCAPWLTVVEAMTIIGDVAAHPMMWKADSLAWRLKLIDADRTALKIRTIGAIDVNKTQRAARRRKASKKRSKLWHKRKALAANAV